MTCAATKPSLQKPAGTLHPLPIPEKPWQVITIDFVGPLPRTPDYFNYVLVVVDKFSKMAHFIPTTTNVTAKETAKLLLEQCRPASRHSRRPSSAIEATSSQPAFPGGVEGAGH